MTRTAAERDAFRARATAQAQRDMTPAERKLWSVLRLDPAWKSQYNLIARTKNGGAWDERFDFYAPRFLLAIECDGGVHKRTRGNDRRRDTRFAAEGIRTLRFSNKRVLGDLAGVLAEIKETVNGRLRQAS